MDKLTTTPSASARPDDATLAAMLREQPAAGVALLYDYYGRIVFSVALRIVRDHGIAEEITQDVFVRCWSSIERYRPERGSLASWLLTIAHHRAVDELRSRRGKAQQRELSDEHLALLASGDPEFDDAILRGEVQKALETLPPAQREVIRLIFWAGLSRREAADQLQVPLGTIHTRLRLGMDKLRLAFGRFFQEE